MAGLVAAVAALLAGVAVVAGGRDGRTSAEKVRPEAVPVPRTSVARPAQGVASRPAGLGRRRPQAEPVSHEAVALPGHDKVGAMRGDGPSQPAHVPQATGRELFAREWRPGDPRSHAGDGLGPVFNGTSCLDCHHQGATGGTGPVASNVGLLTPPAPRPRFEYRLIAMDGRVEGSFSQPTVEMLAEVGNGTGRLESRCVPDDSGTSPQAHFRARAAMLVPALRVAPSSVFHRFAVDPRYGPLRSDLLAEVTDPRTLKELGLGSPPLSERNPPPLFGAGLIDALPDDVFLEAAAREHPGYPKVRGRPHRLSRGRIGRFGWKAQVASLDEFVLSACAGELGLEVPGHHQGASPFAPGAPPPGLDLTREDCDALTNYVRSLPAPAVAGREGGSPGSDSATVEDGRRLFLYEGCATCHTPDLGPVRGIYSDLLLHDMGWKLSSDGQYYGAPSPDPSGAPSSTEWRTPPLWGFRDSAPYLHDGRAQTLEEAVAAHGGEAQASADRFVLLTEAERSRMQAFLNTLVAPAVDSPTPRSSQPSARAEITEHPLERLRSGLRKDARSSWGKQVRDAAARLATRFRTARNLDALGKHEAAREYYRELARVHPDTPEGRQSAARLAALDALSESRPPTRSGPAASAPNIPSDLPRRGRMPTITETR